MGSWEKPFATTLSSKKHDNQSIFRSKRNLKCAMHKYFTVSKYF